MFLLTARLFLSTNNKPVFNILIFRFNFVKFWHGFNIELLLKFVTKSLRTPASIMYLSERSKTVSNSCDSDCEEFCAKISTTPKVDSKNYDKTLFLLSLDAEQNGDSASDAERQMGIVSKNKEVIDGLCKEKKTPVATKTKSKNTISGGVGKKKLRKNTAVGAKNFKKLRKTRGAPKQVWNPNADELREVFGPICRKFGGPKRVEPSTETFFRLQSESKKIMPVQY